MRLHRCAIRRRVLCISLVAGRIEASLNSVEPGKHVASSCSRCGLSRRSPAMCVVQRRRRGSHSSFNYGSSSVGNNSLYLARLMCGSNLCVTHYAMPEHRCLLRLGDVFKASVRLGGRAWFLYGSRNASLQLVLCHRSAWRCERRLFYLTTNAIVVDMKPTRCLSANQCTPRMCITHFYTGGRDPPLAPCGREKLIMETLNNVEHHYVGVPS